ncbi:CHAT domain-containing tetratricopeptide repeat protein [Aureispira sp. CCB-E]|uniref:CHAT domain-containing protein n=1 Tax=Aureispira sp. CCB-E TaxID=3051121 RepID=UPI002869153B|nr:CHAT domain-containing tetratricopeptide repeat protein [Aureispira sp. CCB-E]WMX13971.1 CHAT domain-containing tetratricopeptide repeat protein [Aureispira sp. CCB-E]
MMNYFLYFCFFIGLLPSFLLAQENPKLAIAKLDSLGVLAYYQEDFRQATHFWEQMKTTIETHGLEEAYLGELQYLAALYLETEQYTSAERLYLKLLELQKASNQVEHLFYIQCIGQLGYCYYGMGRYEAAEVSYLEALKIARSILEDEAPTYSSLLNNLALLYNTLGKYEEAEQLYLEVLEIDKKSNSTHYYATSLNNLAVLYQDMGHYEKAEKLYLESQKLREKIYGTNHVNYALGLNNIGNLYAAMNQFFQAETYYQQARKILDAHSPYYIYNLNASAQLHFKQKNYEKAASLWQQALTSSQKGLGEKHPSTAQYWDQLARLYLEQGSEEKALIYCRKAILANIPNLEDAEFTDWQQLDTITYFSNERARTSLLTLLEIFEQICKETILQKKWEEFFTISMVVMHLNERIRNDFTSNANKLRILESNVKSLGCGIHAAVFLGGNSYYKKAFAFAEQNKSILLMEALKGQQTRVLGNLPDSLVWLESSLQRQREQLFQKKLLATTLVEKQKLTEQLNKLNLKIERFVAKIRHHYPQYHQLKYNSLTASVEEIQALLEPQALLLEYFILEDSTYLFAISKNKIEVINISCAEHKLSEYIRSLRLSLSDYDLLDKAPREAYLLYIKSAEWLYQTLLKQVLDNNKDIKDLIVVTDGELGHIPFEVLLSQLGPQNGANYSALKYLVRDYNISYSYSASLWVENLKQSASIAHTGVEQQVLAFAASYPKPQHSLYSLRSENVCAIRSVLEDLPAATKEVKGLSKMFYGEFLTGEQASETNFKKLAAQYSVIHLAMHGVSNEAEPILSALAFSEDYQATEDNFLQAYEVAQLPLNANLVVLSACETGYGKFQQGEGIISLARSFMYAGAPSLVVSLWQVNDQATAIIMRLFYQNLAEGMTKSEALRYAKLNYLELFDGMAVHPALWSAFIQIGDSHAIKLETKKQWYWWLVAGTVGVLILVLGYNQYKKKQNESLDITE